MNGASIACLRAASSRLSVPLALTPKSVCGSFAAQSCEGWAAVCTISSIWPACLAKMRSTPSASRMSISSCTNSFGRRSASTSDMRRVEASAPKNCARMSFSRPTTV